MEFSSAYAIAPKGTSLTKTAYYSWASFYREDGTVLEGAATTWPVVIAKTLLRRAGFATADRATGRASASAGQPNSSCITDRPP